MADGADVIVVGAGLAGLVATAELADAGRRVILLEQEPEVGSHRRLQCEVLLADRPSGRSAGSSSSTRRNSAGSGFTTRTSGLTGTGW